MNIKEGDILLNGTDVFRVIAYIAEPQVTIKPIGTSGEVITCPLSKLPKTMVKLVPETGRIKSRRVSKTSRSSTSTVVSISPPTRKLSFRSNSKMKRAYPFIQQAGKPLSVVEILEGIGEPLTNASKSTMAGDLYRFAKKNYGIKVVGRGLFAYQDSQIAPIEKTAIANQEVVNLPDNFGKD
ncbi:MAG: hypothetical protein HYX79_00100 [Chloroflexi bacterium]|nr:hypothetical protein [Chloroflexota bacterium]